MASKLHETEVDVQILKTKEECDHVQFLITETYSPPKAQPPDIDEIETLSLGSKTDTVHSYKIYKLSLKFQSPR